MRIFDWVGEFSLGEICGLKFSNNYSSKTYLRCINLAQHVAVLMRKILFIEMESTCQQAKC